MKNLILLCSVLILAACGTTNTPKTPKVNTSPSTTITKSNDHNFDWLLGNWQRVNGEPGSNTYEKWAKITDIQYEGFGWTMQGKDTISQEKMILVELSGVWGFHVVHGGDPMVRFKVKETTDESFTCENQDNEFPKVIKYWKDRYSLKAEISGGGPTIPFVFAKLVRK